MKQIKKIVLKDATKLTNSEMKKIRGGIIVDPSTSYSAECSASCYHSTGAYLGNVSAVCSGTQYSYCDFISGADGIIGVACFEKTYYGNISEIHGTTDLCSVRYNEN